MKRGINVTVVAKHKPRYGVKGSHSFNGFCIQCSNHNLMLNLNKKETQTKTNLLTRGPWAILLT